MGSSRRAERKALVMWRSIERLVTIIASLALIAMAVLVLDEGSPLEGSATLDVNARSGSVSVALERYGPSVALTALAVILVPFVFICRMRIVDPEGNVTLYADQRHAGPRLPALTRDEFDDLREAATRARRVDPHSDIAILLSRICQSVVRRSVITPDEQKRKAALIEKMDRQRLSSDEREELARLQNLLTDKDAADWMREQDAGDRIVATGSMELRESKWVA
jgi:hypothetical protein